MRAAEVAARAVAQRTGARGLLTAPEEALRDFKYELPSTSVKRLVVTAETIQDPRAAEEILREDAQKAADRGGERAARRKTHTRKTTKLRLRRRLRRLIGGVAPTYT